MTRAKRELILSCSGTPSAWLTGIPDPPQTHPWSDHVVMTELSNVGCPEHLPELPEMVTDIGTLTGREFLYTPYALGMSPERQDRLDRLITGTTLTRDGQQISWRNLSTAVQALGNQPSVRRVFGGESWKYFQQLFIVSGVKTNH